MSVVILVALIGLIVLVTTRTRRRRWSKAVCAWCTETSGHEVTGHTENACRAQAAARAAVQLASRKR